MLAKARGWNMLRAGEGWQNGARFVWRKGDEVGEVRVVSNMRTLALKNTCFPLSQRAGLEAIGLKCSKADWD